MVKSSRTKEKKVSLKKKTVRETETTHTETADSENLATEDVFSDSAERRRFLYVMRHAKASKDFDAYTDRERPLEKRGKKDAKMMKKFMKKTAIKPKICLVSPAIRARETLEVLHDAFPDADIRFDEIVYETGNDVTQLLDVVRALPEECDEVLVIGHLPAVSDLARLLANEGVSDEDGFKKMGKKFPTSALAVLELNPSVSWNALDVDSCRLSAFVRPKDLKG